LEKIPNLWERLLGRAQETDQSQWKIIALCVLGATTFWFFSALNKQDYNSTINYPLRFEYANADSLVVVDELPSSVRMNVTGGGWNLFRRSLGIGIKPLLIDLPSPTETPFVLGSSLVSEINDQVKLFNLNQVVTDTLHLHIEPLVERSVALAIDQSTISLAPDHVLVGPIEVDPQHVQVSGHASFVNSLKDTLILALDQSDIDDNFDEDLTLPVENPVVKWSSTRVAVSFPVDPLVEGSMQATVRKQNFPSGASLPVEPQLVDIQFKAPSSQIDSIAPWEVKADYRDLSKDSTIQLQYTPPQNVYQVQTETKVLKVTYD